MGRVDRFEAESARILATFRQGVKDGALMLCSMITLLVDEQVLKHIQLTDGV
jgi:hypothetical protein